MSGGRIWKAVPGSGSGENSLASAPEDADLTDPDVWTLADGSSAPGLAGEGVTVPAPGGGVMSVAPAQLPDGSLGVGMVKADGTGSTEFLDYSPLEQQGKFAVIWDDQSDKYWALTNPEIASPRNVVGLFSSTDFTEWEYHGEVIRGRSSRYMGFQYPDMVIDGDDIVWVSRTAWEDENGQPPRWHDGNMFTSHRVPNFRTM